MNPSTPQAKPSMTVRLKALFEEYGPVAAVIYFTIFFAVWVGFIIAIRMGIRPEGITGDAGTIGAAWVATKVTQPVRILATVALTPIVGRLWARFRRK